MFRSDEEHKTEYEIFNRLETHIIACISAAPREMVLERGFTDLEQFFLKYGRPKIEDVSHL